MHGSSVIAVAFQSLLFWKFPFFCLCEKQWGAVPQRLFCHRDNQHPFAKLQNETRCWCYMLICTKRWAQRNSTELSDEAGVSYPLKQPFETTFSVRPLRKVFLQFVCAVFKLHLEIASVWTLSFCQANQICKITITLWHKKQLQLNNEAFTVLCSVSGQSPNVYEAALFGWKIKKYVLGLNPQLSSQLV